MRAVGHIRALLVLALCWHPLVSAMETGPREVVEKAANEVIEILRQDGDNIRSNPDEIYELANEFILPLFDFDKMSYFVLGKVWQQATAQQKLDFQREFKQLLISTYATALAGFKTDEEIVYQKVMVSPKNENIAIVPSEVRRKGAGPIAVAYRMIRADGAWRIYDVVIDGVSLVTNYRANFASKLRSGGLDSLITNLNEHNKTESQPRDAAKVTVQPASQTQ